MAPRPPVTKESMLASVRAWLAGDRRACLGFGAPGWTHGVVDEGGVLRVRALRLDVARAMASGKPMTPRLAEEMSAPTGPILVEAHDGDALLRAVERLPWPWS